MTIRNSMPRGEKCSSWQIACAAFGAVLLMAASAQADSDFEDGFQFGLGQVLAVQVVQAASALFYGAPVPVAVAAPVYYAPVVVAQPVYYAPLVVAHPVVHYPHYVAPHVVYSAPRYVSKRVYYAPPKHGHGRGYSDGRHGDGHGGGRGGNRGGDSRYAAR